MILLLELKPLRQSHKVVKHTQTIRWLLPTNCWSGFDHFVGLALKGLIRVLILIVKQILIFFKGTLLRTVEEAVSCTKYVLIILFKKITSCISVS